MMGPFIPLNILALLLYAAAAAAYGAGLVLDARNAPVFDNRLRLPGLARPLLFTGIGVQVAATGAWCVNTHLSPFAAEYGTLSVLAWIMALALAAADLKYHITAVNAAALPIACLILFWGLLHADRTPDEALLLKSQAISVHVLCILTSLALFALAFGCACCYLLQHRLLKSRSVRPFLRRLPPLATLDTVAYQAIAFGLTLLAVGLGLGIVYMAKDKPWLTPLQWIFDPHNFIAFALLFLYGLYIAARLLFGWRGVRLQYILVAGLILAMALYIVPNVTHHFHQQSGLSAKA